LFEKDNAFYTHGSFTNTVDFDPNAGDKYVTMKGNTDAFLQRLVGSSCVNGSTVTQQSCDVYAYNGTKYTSSGTYNHTFKNQAGCDSIVTLVLTINNSAATTETKTACD